MEAGLQELGVEEKLLNEGDKVVEEKRETSETRPNYENKDEYGRFTGPPGTFKTADP
jgi:hypothetical protein